MSGLDLKKWWQFKGSRIVNERTNNLIGKNIGYIYLENLFTHNELKDLADSNDLFSLIEDMQKDGMNLKVVCYANGIKKLMYYIK